MQKREISTFWPKLVDLRENFTACQGTPGGITCMILSFFFKAILITVMKQFSFLL